MPPIRRLTSTTEIKTHFYDPVADAFRVASHRSSSESTHEERPAHPKSPVAGTSRSSTPRPRDRSKTPSSGEKRAECERCGEGFSHRYMLKSVFHPYPPALFTETDGLNKQTHGEARSPLRVPAREMRGSQGEQERNRPACLGRAFQVGRRDGLPPTARQGVSWLRGSVHSSRQYEAAFGPGQVQGGVQGGMSCVGFIRGVQM